jgi:AraC-like DNA-binding protein
MCPQQYLIHVRLSMAEHLLRTTHKQILAISEEVGFRTLSSFNRLFKKQYGYSPRALR